MRRLAVVLAAFVALVPVMPALAAGAPPATVTYRPPVDAPVVDAFRPPPENWNAGNRGIEYAARPGTSVVGPLGHEVMPVRPSSARRIRSARRARMPLVGVLTFAHQ